ncbi:hypothetical protein ACFLTH_03220 [Bacteroidota bacterium]
MKMKIITIIFLFIISAIPATGQEHQANETNWEVKELWDFHETIYVLWHTAWPDKNIELLKSLIPDLEAGYERLAKVELPGILRDKKAKWEENISKLGNTLNEFKSAAQNDETKQMLDKAENIHTYFEKLVRTIRPAIKEVDSFHQVLYVIYHYHIVEYDYEKIKSSVGDLKVKMDELNNSELPARMNNKKDDFNKARMELSISVDNLCKVVNTGDNKDAIIEAVDIMHTKYQAIEHVFD